MEFLEFSEFERCLPESLDFWSLVAQIPVISFYTYIVFVNL